MLSLSCWHPELSMKKVCQHCAINKPHGRFVYERWWARRRSELKQTQSRNAARSGFPLQNRERWPEAQGCAALVAGDMIWFSLISLLKLFLSLCLFSGCKSLKFQKQWTFSRTLSWVVSQFQDCEVWTCHSQIPQICSVGVWIPNMPPIISGC